MKKILSPKIKGSGHARLADKLRSLVAADPQISALGGQIGVYEAWALDGDRVKVRIEVRLPDQSYCGLTRVVAFPLDPAMTVSHRGWTIVVTPNWYGFGWRLFDESGAAADESSENVGDVGYAIENARREINRQLADRLTGGIQPGNPPVKETAHRRKASSLASPVESEEASPATPSLEKTMIEVA